VEQADIFLSPERFVHGEIKKISIFLKFPASKSLERDEANQIKDRYDKHGSRQPYY
jgi:hypothetical protein